MSFPGKVLVGLFACVCALGCHKDIRDTAYDQTLDIQINPASIESGGAATIMADVRAAMMPKPGVKVTFSASGNCGKLSSESATTQTGQSIGLAGAGQALVTFTGNSPYSTCSAIITATTNEKKTSMITVTPKSVSRTVPEESVPAGETPASVVVIPDVVMPVSNGFSSQYSITASNANIDSIRIVTTQKSTISTSNTTTESPNPANPNDVQFIEPVNASYNSDVITITSDSLKLGKLLLIVTVKGTYGGKPIELRFEDALPGPG